MNTDTGHFVDEQDAKSWMQRIAVHEIIKIKGEECRVVSIELRRRRVTLELLSSDDRMRTAIESPFLGEPRNRHERRAADKKERDG
jgi:hypothetical protein